MMDAEKMGGAIAHWLGFQDNIGRAFMMNEDAIKYPLADYLVNAGGLSINAIDLEHPHPNFSNKLIDIVVINRAANKIEITNAIELKLAKTTTRHTIEQKRIFNDLVRLHLAAQISTGKCYFIITGKSTHFQRDFRNFEKKGIKFYKKWFSFAIGTQNTFMVSAESDSVYKSIYDLFIDEYSHSFHSPNQLQLPLQITTTCEFITDFKPQFVPYMTGIWSVK